MSLDRQNFFLKLKNNQKLNMNMPMVFFFDALGVTSNRNIDLLDEGEGTYSFCIKKVCKKLSEKYAGLLYIYAVGDEISVCISDMINFTKRIDTGHTKYVSELSAFLLQEIAFSMYDYYKIQIFFRTWSISLYEDNLKSYLIWRKHLGTNSMMYYYLSRKSDLLKSQKKFSFNELWEKAEKEIPDFNKRTEWNTRGMIFKNGIEIDFELFIKGNGLINKKKYVLKNL